MCGIAGFFNKTPGETVDLGRIILDMLRALDVRGPDSAGVALLSPDAGTWKLRVKVGETTADGALVEQVLAQAGRIVTQLDSTVTGASLRLSLPGSLPEASVNRVITAIERIDLEVVSVGRQLEILKQVGSPDDLERAYHVSRVRGVVGIGHTRLSTESRVDLSHSQPFWAHGLPDVAVVHNGHITNYGRLRRQYEQHGVHFYTENDSEIIGIYLRDRVTRGDTLQEAMTASMRDFDGSFCYLVAAPGFLGYAKDRFGFKPLVVAETDAWVAVSTEEVALRAALGTGFSAWEPAPDRLAVWTLPELALAA